MPRVNKRPIIIIVLICFALIVLMFATSDVRRSNMTPLEGFVGEIVRPLQKAFYTVNINIYNVFKSFGDNVNINADNNRLKKKVAELEKQLLDKSELEKQNERLQKLLDFATERQEFEVTVARVIAKNPGIWFNTITIDKGKNQGISVNMSVVTDKGLVGRVFNVGPDWAKVRTIIDGQSSVSGIIERTRDNGLVKGNNSMESENGMCRMIYLPIDSDFNKGDKVITSGLGEIFPKGIYIGDVEEVIMEKRDFYKTAVIRPAVDFKRLEEVLVIKKAAKEVNAQ